MTSFSRISVDSKIHFGKPCTAGTHVTARNVLELVNKGFSFQQIVTDYYPELTIADVKACVGYATALVAAEEYQVCGMRPSVYDAVRA